MPIIMATTTAAIMAKSMVVRAHRKQTEEISKWE